MTSYYDILGISPAATRDEIREAYNFQIKVFHPDKYDPAHPRSYARALSMTQRLNEARDTLLDPAKRRLHDQQLSGAGRTEPGEPPPPPPPPPPPEPPAPAPHHSWLPTSNRRVRYAKWAVFGLLVMIFLASLQHPAARNTGRSLGAATQADAAPTPTPCPSGTPTVAITSVSLQTDPTAYMPDELRNRRLYVISGTLSNTTSDTIHANTLGFYLGTSPNFDLPPDWTDDLATLELSGDFTSIPAHSTIAWKDKHVVDWPVDSKGPQPTTVLPVLKFPYSSTSRPESQWYWNDAPNQCATTN